MFPAETYIQRRRRLREQVGSGVLLFLGNDESPMNYADNPFHFRQDSTFLYFFGLNSPGLAAMIDLNAEQVQKCVEEVGIGFMFAPKFHPAMKHAIGPRRELGQRTIFNVLGPLTIPAGATHQLIGMYDPADGERLPVRGRDADPGQRRVLLQGIVEVVGK